MLKAHELIGKNFTVPVGDGFIRVIDLMGDDVSVVQAARISYGDGTKTRSGDRSLIRYLMRNQHSTPFEMCELKIHVRCPIDVFRQWIRHRTASVNEYSTRYSLAIGEKTTTRHTDWRLQSANDKQGYDDFVDQAVGDVLTKNEKTFHEMADRIYDERIKSGVAREQARKDLPLCTFTEAYWKIDVRNLMNFLRLRLDSHAQHEIRMYAGQLELIFAEWMPMTYGAFYDYVKHAHTSITE